MKKILIIAVILFSSIGAYAQTIERQVIGSTGGYATATGMQVSFNVGEAVTATGTSATIVLTQGFEQPDSAKNTAVQNIPMNNATLKVYPNPTQGSVALDITVQQPTEYTVIVYDALGRALSTEQLSVSTREIKHLDFSSYAAGNYIIMLRSGNNEQHSIKVVKQQ